MFLISKAFSSLYNDVLSETDTYYKNILDLWDAVINLYSRYRVVLCRSFKVKTKDKTMTILRPMFVCDRFIQESQKALFYIFQFKEVRIMPKNYLPVLTTGYSSGLVIDFGYRSISILPVAFGVCDLMNYDGMCILIPCLIRSEVWNGRLEEGREGGSERIFDFRAFSRHRECPELPRGRRSNPRFPAVNSNWRGRFHSKHQGKTGGFGAESAIEESEVREASIVGVERNNRGFE